MKPIKLPEASSRRRWVGVAPEAAVAWAEVALAASPPRVAVVLVADGGAADRWQEDFGFYASLRTGQAPELAWDRQLLPELPDGEADDPRRFEAACDRLAALTRLLEVRSGAEGPPVVVVTTPAGLLAPAPAPDHLARRELRLTRGQRVGFRELVTRLGSELGYHNEAVCEAPGQFAVRGGLIDVYPMNAEAPVRLDFFGDELEALRSYDPTTQLTLEPLEAVTVAALGGSGERAEMAGVVGYLPAGTTFLLHEPTALVAAHSELFQQFERIGLRRATMLDVTERAGGESDRWWSVADLENEDSFFGAVAAEPTGETEALRQYRGFGLDDLFGAERAASEAEARTELVGRLAAWQAEGWATVVVAPTEGDAERFHSWLAEEGGFGGFRPQVVVGPVLDGFRLDRGEGAGPAAGLAKAWGARWGGARGVVLAPTAEIFGRFRVRPPGARRRRLPQRAQVDQLLDFSELVEGDPLVHLQHGICLYRGLTKLEHRGQPEEMVTLEFEDGILMHLPLHETHLLSRYVGLTKRRPKLGRLGSGAFERTRQAAQRATLDYAARLLALQAQREAEPGVACGPDTRWQAEFEAAFPHRETVDQLKAIEATKADLERARPMDRLICGDVGFGKTEIALRAAFKVVQEGRQAAILVPTTVLAQQHFQTFKERMAAFPVTVEMVSRFRTKAEVNRILEQVAQGQVDLLIGTHRLLSKDVAYRDLGLLVVDEEHRFGVRDKERLKELRAHVDVLTMSATPIPRTLYLALMGARDLSVIETAPLDRRPIQTVVKTWSPEVVRDAIGAELARGGQVFYLHNRVDSIESVAARVRELVPKARVGVGHGQMTEGALEKMMTKFVAGDYDVLVCTTIIESGLDIPNCNTIIVEAADRFGLAQLYQLRGRVGRFNRQAYAYLLLHRHAALLDQARQRLSALRQYTQPGAGYRIAMRDLELRGAGNLLGAEQSGHIAGVGFELYCQLLRQSIEAIKDGGPSRPKVRCGVRLDFVSLGEATAGEAAAAPAAASDPGFALMKEEEISAGRLVVAEARVPITYLAETRLRIDIYRRLALAETVEQVREVAAGLRDRFGPYPEPVALLLAVTELRCVAEHLGVVSVLTEGGLLKARRAGRLDDFVKIGTRFPRLTEPTPLRRVREVQTFLSRHARLPVSPPPSTPPAGPARAAAVGRPRSRPDGP